MGVSVLHMHMVVGNPKARSRTWEAASEVVRQVAERAKTYGFTVEESQEDLTLLGSELVQWPSPSVEEALGRISEVDFLVVASPTFKASYSGLLKMFLDQMPPGFLSGKTVVPVMVGASPHHGLAVDVLLSPQAKRFGINILREDQVSVSRHFAGKPDRMVEESLPYHWCEDIPVLSDCLASLACRLWDSYDGGDHTFYVGEVVTLHPGEGRPLLFFHSAYRRIGDVL
ncbi:flavin reductase [Kyrpidia tusciae]|uniref:Flavin reductase domain protein FMN-binding protein n=1 Tax=Kyrpidia tusciae (strain DSM 2912 / NBRC 15312 / T2) TaxID=562970 RepID=D5WWB7_KYRT2|nr:flavin reductase [Kyrpidia tusciae]ADG07682.1 flavin reductase domain protein FMN-binding protein [Kyrpidia tusciae DSM 2912]